MIYIQKKTLQFQDFAVWLRLNEIPVIVNSVNAERRSYDCWICNNDRDCDKDRHFDDLDSMRFHLWYYHSNDEAVKKLVEDSKPYWEKKIKEEESMSKSWSQMNAVIDHSNSGFGTNNTNNTSNSNNHSCINLTESDKEDDDIDLDPTAGNMPNMEDPSINTQLSHQLNPQYPQTNGSLQPPPPPQNMQNAQQVQPLQHMQHIPNYQNNSNNNTNFYSDATSTISQTTHDYASQGSNGSNGTYTNQFESQPPAPPAPPAPPSAIDTTAFGQYQYNNQQQQQFGQIAQPQFANNSGNNVTQTYSNYNNDNTSLNQMDDGNVENSHASQLRLPSLSQIEPPPISFAFGNGNNSENSINNDNIGVNSVGNDMNNGNGFGDNIGLFGAFGTMPRLDSNSNSNPNPSSSLIDNSMLNSDWKLGGLSNSIGNTSIGSNGGINGGIGLFANNLSPNTSANFGF